MDATRVDRWLWSIRLCRTRADATELCRGGHVRVEGRPAKPATTVRVGDRVEARVHGRDRIVEVVRLVDKRVGAPVAAECYVDHSPPPPASDRREAPIAERPRGAGRPTKRERRELERWKARNR